MNVRYESTRNSLLRDQIRSELIKVRSARALWVLPVVAIVLSPVTALFIGLTESLEPGDTVLGGALTGLAPALAVLAAWAALMITIEYSSGTIRPVLAATPDRTVLLYAKAAVVGAVGAVSGALSPTLAYLVGLYTIDPTNHQRGEPFPAMLGILVCFVAVALFGLATGVALRSSVGAVAASAAYVVLPQLSSAQITGDLHKWITGASPAAALAKLSQSSDAATELMGTLGGWPRLALVVACTGVAIISARRLLVRGDI